MIKKIDHVGIAVRSVDSAVLFYEGILGGKLVSKDIEEGQKLISAKVSIGDSMLEIMESLSVDGVIAKFIESKGEGIHHLSLRVENFEGLLNELEGKGVKIVGKEINPERKIAFLHPKNTSGVLIEIIEKN
ncbi:MAG: VOC family protein [Syntrophales bacterium]|nr:VOC family protein [Syntrophales bacterium]